MKQIHLKAALALALGCGPCLQAADAPAPANAPAKVANGVKEAELATVTLTEKAAQRLGIRTSAVERKPMRVTRQLAGEVVSSLATLGGDQKAPVLGGTLDEVLRLADAQADADGRIRQAEVQLEAARIALARAEKLVKSEAGTARAVDEANAQVKLAEVAKETARRRRDVLGTPLTQASANGKLWVRVAILAGEQRALDVKAPAQVRPLIAAAGVPVLTALPVSGPPTATALAGTIDLYYELAGGAVLPRPGERVAVTIPIPGSGAESLVVPHAAILHDIHGGQWVYEQTSTLTFTRRRVQVSRVVGDEAVLASGPPAGVKIVTDGAAELFGTEFGAGK